MTRPFLEASQTQYARWSFPPPWIRAIGRLRMTAPFLVRDGSSFGKYVIFILARGLLAFLGLQDSLPGQSRRGELVLILFDVQIPQIPRRLVNLVVKPDWNKEIPLRTSVIFLWNNPTPPSHYGWHQCVRYGMSHTGA